MITRDRLVWMTVSLVLFCGAASAQTCVTPPSGMIAWWTLDETSGIIAKDSVGTEPAAYFGTPAPVQTPGLVAGALNFNGSTDFLSAAQSNLWDFGTSNFTIELWANFGAAPGGSVGEPAAIFIGADEGPENQNKWFFAVGGGYLYFHINGPALGAQFFPLVPFSPTVGVWYHVAVVRNGSTYTIFINGSPAGAATNTNAIPSPNAPLTIGQAESTGFMNGILDEISVYNRALSQTELQGIVNAYSAGKCKLPTASAASPSVGGDAGQVTVTLSGSLFTPTSTVSLSASGLPSITGSTPIVSTDGTSLITTFDLTGQPDGVWNVVVTTPNLPTVTLPQAFTIEPASPLGQVWADIVGRGAIRIGETQEFTLLYGNRSDTDAIDVPIWLAGIPTTATFTPQFTLTEPATVAGYPPIDPSSPITITTSSDIQVPLIINRIPPGAVGALQFSLLVVGTTPIQLVATASPPLASSAAVSSATLPAVASLLGMLPLVSSGQDSASNISLSAQGGKCIGDLVQVALDNLGVTEDATCAQKTVSAVLTTLSSLGDVVSGGGEVVPLTNYGASWTEAAIDCCQLAVPPVFEDILKAWGDASSLISTVSDCSSVFPAAYQGVLNILAVNSYDPNAKQGSQGAGTQQYLSGASPWPYTIAFENDATATAPAQTVTVTDQLDTTNLDLNTFSLGPMGFGNQEVVPPKGLSQFSSYIDLRPATSLIVEVNASLNKTTGTVTWSFNSLDPSTGQAPTNPLVGFLPPDTVPPQGDGQVLFSVLPKSSLSTGQQINNNASVVFDANPAVVTPAWTNTLDNTPPTSSVQPLPSTEPTSAFTVSWSGTDLGSGIGTYTIYVSIDGGPFTVWKQNTTATSATYTGESGQTYGFYSIATDRVGNLEPAKSSAEATTMVEFAAVTISPTSLSFSNQNVGTTSGSQPVTLSNTGSAALTITGMAASANFGQTNNCGGSVAASGSCTINVTFTPTATGSLTGTLTITDNNNGAAGSTQSVALSGSGQDFTLTASSGSSTSVTVAPGSPATYTLSVAGVAGLSGTVTFTCTGAPSGATCTVSPNPANVGSSPTNVTVSVTTTAASIGAPRSRPLPPVPPLSPGLRDLLMLALVLVAMAWVLWRRNQPGVSRWQSTMVPLALGSLLTVALAGCGGGGGGGGGPAPNPGTPAGTYTLTVTGTAGSGSSTLSHNVTLTLKVS